MSLRSARPSLPRKAAMPARMLVALAACLVLVTHEPIPTKAQQRQAPSPVSLQIDDEPGRVSTQEVVIDEGPFARQVVFFRSNEAPGTIIVNTTERFLYVVMGNNRALRYGIGVGREGFQWSGLVRVTRKAEWPDWTPPAEMIERQPYLPRFMAGGPGNPMGARALYLGSTVYRIHGTNAPGSIGGAVSSGCIRMMNADVIELYEKVKIGAPVVVVQ